MPMPVVDFPAELLPHVTRSAFYRPSRVASSRSLFSARPEVQDLGPIWLASVTITPVETGGIRRFCEAWLRSLKGGEVHVRLWDMDYEISGPGGHGLDHAARTGQVAHNVSWSTGSTWLGAPGTWAYTGALRLGADIVPGQNWAWCWGGVPGDPPVVLGDTLGVNGAAALIEAIDGPDATGRFMLTLDPAHSLTGARGDAITFGARYTVTMQWTNPAQAMANETGIDRRLSYTMTFVEAV